jgi:hypothetical protein
LYNGTTLAHLLCSSPVLAGAAEEEKEEEHKTFADDVSTITTELDSELECKFDSAS